MKEINSLLQQVTKTFDLLDNIDNSFPSTWSKDLKQTVKIAVKGNKISESEREFLHRKGAKENIEPEEIDMIVDRIIVSQLEDEKLMKEIDDDFDDEFPSEIKKYMPIIVAMEDGDVISIVKACVRCFAPLLLCCLAVIVVCFFIKWWIGLLSILGVAVFLCMKAYGIYKKLD
ncbi:MAG: hypothetical protein K2N79_00165 [Muribaculaceae bacterium]|nr:hypothetical protein [Muribaculaceae bacterium]MDE7154688.1 hypothetical protein [Muribaculaceae bacterium]MDE7369773.1 hypothetical protein [Muribaculaceae bacterium]